MSQGDERSAMKSQCNVVGLTVSDITDSPHHSFVKKDVVGTPAIREKKKQKILLMPNNTPKEDFSPKLYTIQWELELITGYMKNLSVW